MIEYIKIPTPFVRAENGTRKLIEGEFRDKFVEYLASLKWIFTEKVDGTNVSIEWDGHEVTIHGRTERAQLPRPLLDRLEEFKSIEVEELFEQKFGERHVILYGEGYGGKIQKNKAYGEHEDFILFDVYLPDSDLWLDRESVEEIAKAFGVKVVPVIMTGTIDAAVKYVKQKPCSHLGDLTMEGLVGRPVIEMKDKQGKRIIVKVKVKDFDTASE